jgi:hypothetical protein
MTDTLGRIGVAVVIGFIGLIALRAVIGATWGIVQFAWFIFTVVALVDVIGSSRSVASKVVWALVILFVPILGLLAYWLAAR